MLRKTFNLESSCETATWPESMVLLLDVRAHGERSNARSFRVNGPSVEIHTIVNEGNIWRSEPEESAFQSP